MREISIKNKHIKAHSSKLIYINESSIHINIPQYATIANECTLDMFFESIFIKKNIMKRQDLLTKEEFTPKRINQKFANPQNRIMYYNNKANEFRHSIAYISKPLQENIRILNELMKSKKEETFHIQFLKGKGFKNEIHTHIEKYEGKNCLAIHRYLILQPETEKIKIITYK